MRRSTLVLVLCFFTTAAVAGARSIVAHGVFHAKVTQAHSRTTRHSTPATVVLLGDTSVEKTGSSAAKGRAEVFPVADKVAGTASAISVYIPAHHSARMLIAGLYGDKAGHPAKLLASGMVATTPAGAWAKVSIKPVDLKKGTAYWVALMGRSSSVSFRNGAAGTCDSQLSKQNAMAALPSSWSQGRTTGKCPLSAFVTGTPTASTSSVPPGGGITTPTTTVPTTTAPVIVTLPPVNSGAPTVSGTAMQDQTLTVTNGSWLDSPTSYSYQWQRCTVLCSAISGAAGPTYTLQAADVGDTIQVLVGASNAGGSGSASSARTATVAALPKPTNTTFPSVFGTMQQGDTVTAQPGSWTGSPTAYAYQWQRCSTSCANITGATSTTYALGSADVGDTIDVIVTATNDGGSTAATSAKTATVTAADPGEADQHTLPAITGTTQQGNTLTASQGSWTGSPTSYSYQWQDCSPTCANITGATSSTYTLGSGDVGDTIDVTVTATNAGGSTTATSAKTATITAATPAKPTNTTLPAITGTTQQGNTLTASQGSWTGSPTSYSYQWQDCSPTCANITGATSSTYTLGSGDVGDTIDVTVTATNAGGSTTATSAKTATITAATPAKPTNTTLPAITGTTQQGNTLTASQGSWTGSPTSYSYQWQDCSPTCANITGATSSTYTLGSGDVGDTIDVTVTATNAGGSTTATSAKTATITAATPAKPTNTTLPAITGTTQQGNTLTASQGSWTGSPTSYSYQWQDCSPTCANISGATSSTYTLGSGDVGDTIDVTVTATNTGGSTTATSAQTSTVTASSGSVLDGLKVSGANMVDDTGTIVHLHGVNRSGTEYQCAHGAGFFDGPSDAASVAAMASWHINIVRVPINALCWLGDNGVPSQYGGQNYINAIVTYVNLLHSYGIYAEISLMWSMPGNLPANESYQINAPDQDHAPATWTGMAQAFKNDPNVILSPWGETYVDYPCLMQGCSDQASIGGDPGDSTGTCGSGCWHYQSAGMQEAVTDMRNAGYNGPIAIPCDKVANICADPNNGGSYANGTWLTTKPTDPDNQILAEMHLYGGNTCDTTTCLNTTIKPILNAGYPVIFGETGDSYDGSTCPGTTNLQTYLTWAEQNNVGTEAWAWDTWGGCSTGSLITNYNGTPNTGQGTLIQTNYQTTFPANP